MKATCATLLTLGLCILTVGCGRKSASTASPGEDKTRRGTFTIGKKTTYIDGPLDKNGHIDYAAALNQILREGVTPENNANVLLWQAIGPNPHLVRVPEGYFAELGIPEPAPSSDYFVRLDSPTIASGTQLMNSSETILDELVRRPWKASEFPVVDSWLTANEKALSLVVEASKRSRFYSPVIPPRDARGSKGLWHAVLPGVRASRELAIALVARGMLRLGEGKDEAARQDLLACHRLGRLLAQGALLIDGLVGVAIDQIACRADLAFVEKTQPNSEQAAAYTRELRALPALPGVKRQIDLGERFAFLDTVMAVDRNGFGAFTTIREGDDIPKPPDEAFLDGIAWDPALVFANRCYDRAVEALNQKERGTRNEKLAELLDREFIELQKQFLDGSLSQLSPAMPALERGKTIGEHFVLVLFPAARKVQDAHDRGEQSLENVTTAMALAAYKRDMGHYPDKIDALMPKYLRQAPRDLFSGKPPIYKPSAKGYLLYSVGPNGEDDGGLGLEDEPSGDDIVVRVPQPKQK
jgi:hypothetical protein